MPYIDVDGERCFYSGNINKGAHSIVFLHGAGGAHHHFAYQLKGLRESLCPIAVDLPGHGRSGGSAPPDIERYSSWLEHFLDRVGIDSAVIGGHSMGGAIALTHAARFPNTVKSLILIGTGAKLRVMPALLLELEKGALPPNFTTFLYSQGAPAELVEQARLEAESVPAALYHAGLKASDRFDLRAGLGHIKQPALAICGSEDRLTPLKYSLYLQERMPYCRALEVEGAGHMVMLERPQEVNEAIETFSLFKGQD